MNLKSTLAAVFLLTSIAAPDAYAGADSKKDIKSEQQLEDHKLKTKQKSPESKIK